MTSSSAALRIAIVGAGPRGLYALERLTSHAARHVSSLAVDVYDPTPYPGAGPVYAPDQPSYLRMNFVAGQVDAWWPDGGIVPRPLRRSLVDWLTDTELGRSTFDGTIGAGLRVEDRYVPRAVVGRYLQDAFSLVERCAPPWVRLRRHRVAVTAIAPEGDGWRVESERGPRNYDELLVAGAHRDTDRRALACGWGHAAPLVRAVFPVERWLTPDRVPRGSTIAMRGLALTAIDATLALTEGRGGRFVTARTHCGLRYEPGHETPVTIVPYSRSGRPMRPKPTAAVFARIAGRTEQDVAAAIDRLPTHPAGAEAVGELARTVGDVADAVLVAAAAATEDARHRLTRWTSALAGGAPGPTERATQDELRQGYSVATGAAPLDAEAALGIAWRLVYPAVVARFGGAPLEADGWRCFRALAAELERVGFGPSAENVAKLLALVDAGIVRLDHAAGGRLVDRVGITELRSEAGAVPVDRVLDAVLPGPGVDRAGRSPLERLLATGHGSVAAGQRGLRVDPVDATALDRTGKRITGLAAIGRNTEDATIGNDTLNRALHPQVDRWAQRVVTRASIADAPSADSIRRGTPTSSRSTPRRPFGGLRAALEPAIHEDAER